MSANTVFISGHLDVTSSEFEEHYAPQIRAAWAAGAHFVVGDARGADTMAQGLLHALGAPYKVYHMFEHPRNNPGVAPTCGGFVSDGERDAAMTRDSTRDIAWVRPGREKSGTAKNLARRSVQRDTPLV